MALTNRMTTSTMYGSLLNSLQKNLGGLQELQKQIATGNKYTKLSDNPNAIAKSLNLQSSINSGEKYYNNSRDAVTMLKYVDSALNNVHDALQQIRTLVIQAGNGSYDTSELNDIADAIEAQKDIMLDNLNARIAGKYIFGGTDTSTPPFSYASDGSIVYNGNDTRMAYGISEGILGDVNFAGSEVMPKDETTHFICSHYVPLDWQWTGREEKVQITVGSRTISVFIPEDWVDEVASGKTNVTDYNGFRDPNEVSGISLDDLAALVNRSLTEQGADMLVTASVVKDNYTGQQQMILRSNTTEKIGITGWTDTDYLPMAQKLSSLDVTDDDISIVIGNWNKEITDEDMAATVKASGLMGTKNVLDWQPDGGSLTIFIDDFEAISYDNLDKFSSITELVNAINNDMPVNNNSIPVASLVSGRLVLQSTSGKISVGENNSGLFYPASTDDEESDSDNTIYGSTSALSFTIGDDEASTVKIYFNDTDELSDIAEKINNIEGLLARTSADESRLIVVAKRTGDQPSDRLSVDAAQEALHYPSLKITGEGNALKLFDFNDNGELASELETRPVDHSHMDVFDVLGMETAMKSVEFAPGQTLDVTDTLHWRISSGGRSVDIVLNEGEYTMTDLADRIRNATSGWLEVTVDVYNVDSANGDSTETGISSTRSGTKASSTQIDKNDDSEDSEDKGSDFVETLDSLNYEAKTQRLVIRGYKGEQVLFMDVNGQHYADELGLSTALRTYGYTDNAPGIGVEFINFPSAPCVDDSVGARMRVQMNCGKTYDVSVTRSQVIDEDTGFVDRAKVMQQIVSQVNAQEGSEIMGINLPTDDTGTIIDDAASIYFLSGEGFTVVDLPFSDPEWDRYSGGIAAQMGIHGGVTSNLKMTDTPIRDSETIGDVGSDVGTIRISNLGHSVDIDISADDTVKSILDRLRIETQDWLYVNYYDQHMGQMDADGNLGGRNSGDFPIIALSSVDGSAVNVIDIQGTIANKVLGLSTCVQGESDITTYEWNSSTVPAETLTIKVAGYEHTIDLTAMRDVNDDGIINYVELVEFVNARMQDYDVQATVNDDGKFTVWSPRGYNIEIEFGEVGTNYDFMGTAQASTYYRGGYALDVAASTRTATGIHNQNATIRSGSNTTTQNGFGTIDDITAAIKSGNIDDLENKMLPRIDAMLENLLGIMSEGGALQTRYTANMERLTTNELIMTEEYDDLVKADPADLITQMMMADYMYQSNLAIMARIIQPSLLDFLS